MVKKVLLIVALLGLPSMMDAGCLKWYFERIGVSVNAEDPASKTGSRDLVVSGRTCCQQRSVDDYRSCCWEGYLAALCCCWQDRSENPFARTTPEQQAAVNQWLIDRAKKQRNLGSESK